MIKLLSNIFSAKLTVWLWRTSKGYRKQTLLNLLVGVLLVATDLAFVWATKWAVDIATASQPSGNLRYAILLLAAIIISQILLGIASKWIAATLGVNALNRMQRGIFRQLLESDWMEMKKYHTGNLINRIERDVTDIVGFLTEGISTFTCTLIQFIGAFTFLLIMDSTLATIIIILIPLFLITSKLYVKKMRTLTHHVRNTESQIQSTIQESLQHTLVVKTMQRTGDTLEKLSAHQRQLRSRTIEKTKYSTISSTILNSGFALGYLITFTWGTVSLQRGLITYGALIAFVQLVSQIQAPMRQLTKFIPYFISTFTAAERIIEIQQIPREEKSDEKKIDDAVSINMNGITYSYSPESRTILKDFNFTFPAGSTTAILGETGAGKTTLIRLILALIKPQEGQVLLTDTKGNEYQCSPNLRCNFSYVPQGNTLLSGTIRENLLMANPKATEEELLQALRDSESHFIEKLPQGIDTPCGEMGDGLSEGQAQRISIARALLKKAPILLLDEATSALDSLTEQKVLKNIANRKTSQTVIIITHRPKALEYCSQVLTIERKKS